MPDAGRCGSAPRESSGREMTVHEAVSMAIVFQKAGRLEDAGRVLRRVLDVAPGHPAALHYAGVLAHQEGRTAEGIALVERSLLAEPGEADWHSNLGILLKAAGRLDEAIAAYQRAIGLDPGHAKAHNNLGVLLRAQGQFAGAEASYRTAIALDPDYGEAYHNLGVLLASRGRAPEAVAAYCRATVLSPHTTETRRLLALSYCTLGERDKAVRIFEDWLREEPDNPVARHMLAACSGDAVPDRASDAFVERIFDDFAASFDAKLAMLSYRAPQLVAAMLADAGVPADAGLDVLDAGCGTGLCGPLLKPYARRLVGVDLSGRMLEAAKPRGVYDELCQSELTAYLAARPGAFDVIVSADTLVYFGSLRAVAAAAAAALRPGGRLIFTLEETSADRAPSGYELNYHGRYGHARGYVEEVLREAGYRTAIVQAELRMESGLPVAGLVVCATRPGCGDGS
jgi:predicted TPR repeat methyltransferase